MKEERHVWGVSVAQKSNLLSIFHSKWRIYGGFKSVTDQSGCRF